MTDMTVAKTIHAQLGGARFNMMTGAKDFVGGENKLQFKIPRTRQITHVLITLDANDTYTMEFKRWMPKTMDFYPMATHKHVYCDKLQEIFTMETGLFTKL